MGIAVLGPLKLDSVHGALGRRHRVVLSALAVHPGDVLSADRLADVLWGNHPPASAGKVVQGCIVRLRKVLGQHAIETSPLGYRLTIGSDEIDAQRFVRAVARVRGLVAEGEFERAAYVALGALSLWRGPPWEDLDGWDAARIDATRLTELHLEAEELWVESSLRIGRHDEVLAKARSMVSEAPLRERRWALLALAQYQAGRQGEALATLRQLRTVLINELGLDPGPAVEAVEQAILRQDPSLVVSAAVSDPDPVCPYPGLQAYDIDDAHAFFGRETDVAACLLRLGSSSLLAVVGPSGSGKSSLVRAGVAASLRDDGHVVSILTPGSHPTEKLVTLPPGGRGRAIVVDQAEEVFSLCADTSERTRFLDELTQRSVPGKVILALRADHLTDLASYPDFARAVEHGLYLLAGMSEEALRASIEGPAGQAGLVVEAGLTDLLISEVGNQPGALPLMSHALRETWLRREGRALTVAGYHGSGGIRGAVAKTAEDVYERLGAEDQPLLRSLLLRLVTLGVDGEPVRSRLPRRSVVTDPRHGQMLDLLVTSRLLTSDQETVELAHEAVARAWPRLRGWLEDDVEGQRILHHLAPAADEWDSAGRPDSELYRGVRLAKAIAWQHQGNPDLTVAEVAFLSSSQHLAQAELRRAEADAHHQAQVNRKLRGVLAVAAVLLLLATGAGLYAVRQTDLARAAADEARASAAAADAAARSADARRVGARALIASDISRSLLLALAGVRLDSSSETQTNLLAAMARHGRLVRSVPTAGGYLGPIQVSPDGRLIAAVDNQAQVHLYDAATSRLIDTYRAAEAPPGGQEAFTAVAFSPTSEYLAIGTGGSESTGQSEADPEPVRLVDVVTGERVAPWLKVPGHGPLRVNHLAFSADGRYLAASLQRRPETAAVSLPNFGDPAFALVWDLRSADQPPGRATPRRLPSGLALSPDGHTIYSQSPLAAYDVATGERLWARDIGRWLTLDVNPAGTLLALHAVPDSPDNEILVVDARTGETRRRLVGHEGQPQDVRFSHDGALVASASRGGEIIVWDTRTGQARQHLATHEDSWSLDFSPDDRLLYSGGDDEMLRTWDLSGEQRFLRRVASAEDVKNYTLVQASPDGRRVAHSWPDDNGARIRFVNTTRAAGKGPMTTMSARSPDITGDWHPDGTVYTAAVGRTVSIVDAVTGRIRAERLIGDATIDSLAFFDDGQRILVADEIGHLHVLDGESLLPGDQRLEFSTLCCAPVAAAPDGRTAVVFDLTQDAARHSWRVIDVETGDTLGEGELDFRANAADYSPDGRRIVVAGNTGEIAAIEVSSGQIVSAPTVGHLGEAVSVRISPDGSRVISGAADGTVSLWEGQRLELLGTVTPFGPEPVAASPSFAEDARLVLITGDNGQTVVWDTRPDTAIAYACRMAGRNLTAEEWTGAFGDRPYAKTCRQLD